MNKCKRCQSPIVLNTNKTKLFCSKKCREVYWRESHPEKWKEHQRKFRQKTPVLCKLCKKEIPIDIRKSGLVFCSDECRVVSEKTKSKLRRENIIGLYGKYKKEIGCQRCGYNTNSACLDFHHVDGKEKERRITSGLWYYSTDLFKKELKKCVLLCKNCHYDLHNPQIKENGDI